MPKPTSNETKKEFVNRCIAAVIREGTTDDPAQAAAICYSIWRQEKNQTNSELLYPDNYGFNKIK